MARTVRYLKGGVITIPKAIRDSLNWTSGTELSVERIGDQIVLRNVHEGERTSQRARPQPCEESWRREGQMSAAQTPAEPGKVQAQKLRYGLSRTLKPLGDGKGRSHNQYVSRWKTKTGIPVVSENDYPNVWLTKAFFVTLDSPDLSEIAVEEKSPTGRDRGFHSNVIQTPGMNGTVVKLCPAGYDHLPLLEYLQNVLAR